MQMFEPASSDGFGGHGTVQLSATDGSLTQALGSAAALPSGTGLYLPCRLRNETAAPSSFGADRPLGAKQDAGRVAGVPVASEVATDTRHGRRFFLCLPG